ncbi:mRNA export factor GLE1 isoform X2 [Salvia miltiorrhiza]|nr:mRNA export factor GLE1 isoform X2 [Salvia miltiorrhiza]
MQCHQLMDKAGLAEGAVYELTNEFRLSITDAVRSKISSLETELVNENEKFGSLTTKIDKYRELQHERERKLDLQYQRTIAEALDNHLTAVQRDHEHISQLEERRIRDDMARAEAKRREKAIQEEKIRQERIKAEEEAKLRSEMAERAKLVALEAEKKAAEEAAAKHASEALDTAPNAGKDSKEAPRPSVRNIIRASENALELEKRRQQIYEELSTKNKALNQDYHSLGKLIGRLIRTISATMENIRTRAEEIIKLINSSQYPQSISIKLFAEKIVSNCTNQRSSNAIFAASRVVVIVTSKIPLAMDIVIAELNRVCIYTVPKHISYSEVAFRTKDDYFKAIGYMEVDGKIEGLDEYVERLSSYMKLYGALVQTDVGGFQNLHGTKEGWAWLARFLNTIPANLFTAVALDSFLGMAGYGMYCRYKNQFEKLLSIIAGDFLNALQEGGRESRSAKVSKVKMSIRNYIESKQYMKEPEGLQLRSHLDSHVYC